MNSYWVAPASHDSMTYGCKIMVSLTLCGFLDHPVVLEALILVFQLAICRSDSEVRLECSYRLVQMCLIYNVIDMIVLLALQYCATYHWAVIGIRDGCTFADDELQYTANGWPKDHDAQFFYSRIRALEERWAKCISVAGDCLCGKVTNITYMSFA